MINLILKLPGWLLILFSGNKQVSLEHRKLHPPFQFILSQIEKLKIDYTVMHPSEVRASYEAQNETKKLPSDIQTKDHHVEVSNGKILVREYSSRNVPENSPALVYFHGGGWVIGSVETHNMVCANLCERMGIKIFSADYRLAPEHKHPTQLNDSIAAFDWVHDNADKLSVNNKNISVGGDSAGGNLAASLCLSKKEKRQTMPKAQLLIYPVTDLQFETQSIQKDCAEGFMLTKSLMEWFAKHYLESQESITDPLVSPLLNESFNDLPSAVVITAGFDPLRDEGNKYAEKLKDANVLTIHKEYESFIHGFVSYGQVPKVSEAMDEIADSFSSLI